MKSPDSAPFDDAFAILRENLRTADHEEIATSDAVGRIVVRDVQAQLDVPPFSRAMMDGFAVRCESATEGAVIPVRDKIQAGSGVIPNVEEGCAVRIMTGSRVPSGADAVLRFEWAEEPQPGCIKVLRSPSLGESIQARGDDGKKGDTILRKGQRIRPEHVALLHSFGVFRVYVASRPKVTVIPTGSEVAVADGRTLSDGLVYNVNAPLIASLLKDDGCLVNDVPPISDDAVAIREAIAGGLAASDIVILTGGVSKGDADYTGQCIHEIAHEQGEQVLLKRVQLRPGTPFVFAKVGDKAIFGLSGNPAASYIQFETLVRPAIRLSMGLMDSPFPHSIRLSKTVSMKAVPYTRVLRSRAYLQGGELIANTDLAQSAGAVSSFGVTNCLVRIDDSYAEEGTIVPARLTSLANISYYGL